MVEPHTASTNQPQKETQARRQTEKEKGTMEHEEIKEEEKIQINDIDKSEAKKEVERGDSMTFKIAFSMKGF